MPLVMKRRARTPEKPKDDSGPQLIGYARVSTPDQSLDMQTDALTRAGCLLIFEEKKSGASSKRPQLDLAINALRPQDTLVVWRLDRFARSGVQLYDRLAKIDDAGASFKSLQENFDFSTTTGKFVLGVLGLVAEMERNLIRERTTAGMRAQAERGRHMGRPIEFTETKKRMARKMLRRKKKPYTRAQIAKKLKISPATLFTFIRSELR